MKTMSSLLPGAALLLLSVGIHAQETEQAAPSSQAISVSHTYASGEAGYVEALQFLKNQLTRTSKDNWMRRLDFDGTTWIRVVNTRPVSMPIPDRFELEVQPQGRDAAAGDQWSATVCFVYPSGSNAGSMSGPYDNTWTYVRHCDGAACGWGFLSFASRKTSSCDATDSVAKQ